MSFMNKAQTSKDAKVVEIWLLAIKKMIGYESEVSLGGHSINNIVCVGDGFYP